ncbi:response regulator transcription factor [Desulfurispira natronophila]|uniref:YesN/AraC family two-component response regulator n=1 Tax=Desulfurispira natronophila TaxID=682562 RepID=A0A7W7Y3Z2_9BACT|nr:response regulator [Desulfurispira natronophila]MBB5021504.1 YesN/AraC family two-component response regulator [Desulfurispira natronophila]
MPSSQILHNLSILYVEDEVIIKKIMERSLTPLVKHLYIASNGREGLAMYEQNRPDVIITDINMPVMSGLEMIRRIRHTDSATPIIAATAFSEEDYYTEVVELEVDSFLIKPISVADLVTRIESVVAPQRGSCGEQILTIGPDEREELVVPALYQFLRQRQLLPDNARNRDIMSSPKLLQATFDQVRQLHRQGAIIFLDENYLPVLDMSSPVAPSGKSIEQMEAYLMSQCRQISSREE